MDLNLPGLTRRTTEGPKQKELDLVNEFVEAIKCVEKKDEESLESVIYGLVTQFKELGLNTESGINKIQLKAVTLRLKEWKPQQADPSVEKGEVGAAAQ